MNLYITKYLFTQRIKKVSEMGLFGPEKITLMLERYNFFPGEKISGKVALNLKKPTKARKFEVGLYGTRRETHRSRGKTETRYVQVYDFKIPLGQEGEYQTGEWNFEIPIPDDILMIGSRQRPEGKLGVVSDVVSAIGGGTGYYPIEWSVQAQLDVPMKLDIKKSQKIVIA